MQADQICICQTLLVKLLDRVGTYRCEREHTYTRTTHTNTQTRNERATRLLRKKIWNDFKSICGKQLNKGNKTPTL